MKLSTFMEYEVLIKRKIVRHLSKLPDRVQTKFWLLVENLEESGPVQPKFPNYSKLQDGEYHCHLGYSWAACWKHEKDELTIEVYYVGSRENAPY